MKIVKIILGLALTLMAGNSLWSAGCAVIPEGLDVEARAGAMGYLFTYYGIRVFVLLLGLLLLYLAFKKKKPKTDQVEA